MEKKKEKMLSLGSKERELFSDLMRPKQLQLNCPECGNHIGGEHINIVKAIAKCNNCNTLMTLEDNHLSPGRRRPEVFMPKGIEMLRLSNELSIDISWRKNSTSMSFLTLFALIWNGILFPVAFFAILSGEFHMLIFMSLHLTVGIGLLYYIFATFVNTTYITVDERQVSVEHRPLKVPFYPNRSIPTNDIEQIYVDKYVASTSNGSPNYAYAVQAILKNRKRVKLLAGMDDPQQSLYVEQEIESFLDIPDREVEEEWKG